MARTRSFDREAAARAALNLFWRVGYEAAAIPDLERETGLSRSSIYSSFGSKRGLFDAAVQRYLDDVIRPWLRPLESVPVDPGALADYLTGLRAAMSRPGPARNGCLLINAAGSPIARDETVARTIVGYRNELRAAIGRGIDARLPALPGAEASRLADACTGQVIAAFALVRVSPTEAAAALDTALALVSATDATQGAAPGAAPRNR